MKFTEFDLNDSILDAIDAMRFDECTPIQEKAIPPLLEGKDLIGIAQTGTGKTAAYLLPILHHLSSGNYPKDAVNCLILSPTRELAQQIDQVLEAFSYFLSISSVAVYGGNDGQRYHQELQSMKLGADIIIATPGRLISHLTLGNLDLKRTSFFVLDEADRMLDMGFFDDVLKIASYLPKERQTLMFSATMPPEIAHMARTLLHDPIKIEIAISKPAEGIDQQIYFCQPEQKEQMLHHLLMDENRPHHILLFSSSKQKVKELYSLVHHMKISAQPMHSDLDQKQRDATMRSFKSGETDLLVATDIIARGIDIDDIEMVINYDVPHDAEDYVHRVGRTARAGRTGKAVTLVTQKELSHFRRIEKVIGRTLSPSPLPDGMETPVFQEEASTHKKRNFHHRGNNNSTGDGNNKPKTGNSSHHHSKFSKEHSHQKTFHSHRRKTFE